jgi:hypothetical protein
MLAKRGCRQPRRIDEDMPVVKMFEAFSVGHIGVE